MKKLILLQLVLCFFGIANAQQLNYPSLSTVVDEFDKFYAVKNNIVQLELSKEPDGWFVMEKGFKNEIYKTLKKQLFWSKAKNDFLALGYPSLIKGKRKPKKTLRTFITNNSYHVYGFERHYYYNYTFDNKHTIEALANKKNLTDSLLEALARAYSAYARPLNDTSIKEYPNLPPISITAKVPENYADTFVKYVDLDIATCRRLYMQNPYYETMVGNIFIKYSNEHMYAYLVLCEWGYEDKARKYLKEGLYGDAFLSFSKNYLVGVEDNSIIITNGDNDTYPLLYLQLQKGIKPNVHIINNSLLGVASYVKMIRKGYSGISSLPLSITQEAYKSKSTDYALTKTSSTKVISNVQELVNYINNNYTNPRITFNLKNDKLAIPVNIPACIANNQLNPRDQVDSIHVSLSQYIYRSSIAILDIIHSNNWQKTIYFSSLGSNSQITLKPYLKNTGLTPILSPTKSKLNTYTVAEIDSIRLYNNLMHKYTFNTNGIFMGAKGQGFRYNASGLRGAYSFLNTKNTTKEKAKEVALKGLNIIPNSYTPYGQNCITIAANLVNLAPKKAEETLITVIGNLYHNYKNPKPLRQFFYDKAREKAQFENTLQVISGITFKEEGSNLEATLAETEAELSILDEE